MGDADRGNWEVWMAMVVSSRTASLQAAGMAAIALCSGGLRATRMARVATRLKKIHRLRL